MLLKTKAVLYGDSAKNISQCIVNSNFPFQTRDGATSRTFKTLFEQICYTRL